MIFKFFIFILIPLTALGFDKDFKVVNDRVPLEFQLLFEALKTSSSSSKEKVKLIGICKELDTNLGYLEKEHIYLLLKSFVIKGVLELKHKQVRSFDVTDLLLERLEENFKAKEKYLNQFSLWVWRSILAELRHRKKLGLISTRSFSPANFSGPQKVEAERFSRYLNYLLPWIDKMDSLTVEEFNTFTRNMSWQILDTLVARSVFFKRFATTAETDTKVTIFNIPEKLLKKRSEDFEKNPVEDAPRTLSEESTKLKTQAQKEIQPLSADDLSPLSEDVAEELEKKAP